MRQSGTMGYPWLDLGYTELLQLDLNQNQGSLGRCHLNRRLNSSQSNGNSQLKSFLNLTVEVSFQCCFIFYFIIKYNHHNLNMLWKFIDYKFRSFSLLMKSKFYTTTLVRPNQNNGHKIYYKAFSHLNFVSIVYKL